MSPMSTSAQYPSGTSVNQSAFGVDDATPHSSPGETVTAVAGSSFLLCAPDGEIIPGGSHGYFAGDTRLVDELRLRIDGRTPTPLSTTADDRCVGSVSTVGDPTRPELLVERRTRLGDELVVELSIEHLSAGEVSGTVDLLLATDFADVFDVKRGVNPRAGFIGSGPIDGRLVLSYQSGTFHRGLVVSCDRPSVALRDGLHVPFTLPSHGRIDMSFTLAPRSTSDTPLDGGAYVPIDPGRWSLGLPRFRSTDASLDLTWERAGGDLGSLLLAERDRAGRPIVAAGSPWFMALFGRDSLITSWAALPLDHGLALGTLEALAARQGVREHRASAEQPGRILHELRNGEVVLRPDGWGAVYYGSVDATPLFVMTLAELWRWGAAPDDVARLLPAAERAVEWMTGPGDPDGDGFVEYGGSTASGIDSLANQGWKDSDDAVRHPDGAIATGPITLVEVQGYVHAALLALADLRAAFGTGDPEPLRARAAALLDAIDDCFWMPDEGCFALALDGDDRPVRSIATNAGHLLWTGSVKPERVRPVVERLMADDMFTGFGLRTLSASNGGYNPLSYHCGSVWPHDSALVAAGMYRAGAAAEGGRLARGLFDASAAFGGRPPELFGGFDRERFSEPVPYPTSCSPQAWASASTLLLVRSMLGLRPDVPNGVVEWDPRLPPGLGIEMNGIGLGAARLDLRVQDPRAAAIRVSEPLQVVRTER